LQETNGNLRRDDDANDPISLHHMRLVKPQGDDQKHNEGDYGHQQPETSDFVKIPEYPTKDFVDGKESKDCIQSLCRPVDVEIRFQVITKPESHDFNYHSRDSIDVKKAKLLM